MVDWLVCSSDSLGFSVSVDWCTRSSFPSCKFRMRYVQVGWCASSSSSWSCKTRYFSLTQIHVLPEGPVKSAICQIIPSISLCFSFSGGSAKWFPPSRCVSLSLCSRLWAVAPCSVLLVAGCGPRILCSWIAGRFPRTLIDWNLPGMHALGSCFIGVPEPHLLTYRWYVNPVSLVCRSHTY